MQIKRPRVLNADYASRAGDARRSGRAAAEALFKRPPVAIVPAVLIGWRETASHVEARLGVIVVGVVTHDPAAGGYYWAVFLPDARRTPVPAPTAERARAALESKIREWCAAARLVGSGGAR